MTAKDSSQTPDRASEALPQFPVPERPPLPRPERINRNTLTIAAVAMGTLVLAAVVFVQPGRPNDSSVPAVLPPASAEPTFLDQPAPGAAGGVAPGAVTANGDVAAAGAPAAASGRAAAAPPIPSGTTPGAPVSPGDWPEAWHVPARPRAVPVEDPETIAYRAAVAAPLRPRAAVEATDASLDLSSMAVTVPPSTPISAAPVPGASGGVDRRWGKERGFLQDVGAGDVTSATRATLAPAPGPYAIQAGTMIPAVLLTEINSDLPGDVLAQVAHDVFDSRSQETLLIPKGARLLGTYDSDVSSNQRRLFVAWTRVIFPDGRSLALPGLETKDRSGAGGVADRVESHRRRTFGVAALLSLVSAGAQLAQPNGGYGAPGSYPSAGQVAAGAAGQQLSQVATEMLRRQMDVTPTIRIRQGMPFQVFLRTDIAFPSPYEREGAR